MKKRCFIFCFMVGMSVGCFAAEGRWSLTKEKRTGRNLAVLVTESKRTLKEIPLVSVREYLPVSAEEIKDDKLKSRALDRGLKFARLSAKDSAATPLEDGRLLVLQEQTVVMPPQPEDPTGQWTQEFKAWAQREPDENSIWVTLFDASGKVLWSRKYGPLAGRLPTKRQAWAESAASGLEPGDVTAAMNEPPAPPKKP